MVSNLSALIGPPLFGGAEASRCSIRMTLDNMKIDDVSMPMIRVAVLLDRDVGLDAQPRDRCKASPL